MFAAAAIFARWAWDSAMLIARWAAVKVLVTAILVTIVPWVLKNHMVWIYDLGYNFFTQIMSFVFGLFNQIIANAGIDIDINLSGVGGYIAGQVGLDDYALIIFSGWGIYWSIIIASKAFSMIKR
jgi:hypothetical protein